MPFKKTYSKKKTYGKRKQSAGVQALKMVKQLTKATETKYHDVQLTDTSVAAAGAVFNLSNITAGTTDSTRIGDKVFMKNLQILYSVKAINAAGIFHGLVRVMVVQIPEKIGSGSTISITDVLETANVVSLYNRDADKKYRVLYNRYHKIADQTKNAGVGSISINRKNFKINKVLDKDGSNVNNSLYFVILHDYEDNDIDLEGHTRLTYTDS